MIGFLVYSESVPKWPPVTGSGMARLGHGTSAWPQMVITFNFMKFDMLHDVFKRDHRNHFGGTLEPVPDWPEPIPKMLDHSI